jgi:hypothetical protein
MASVGTMARKKRENKNKNLNFVRFLTRAIAMSEAWYNLGTTERAEWHQKVG